jgi:hypothetical protein
MLDEAFQYKANMVFMLSRILRINENIVKVENHEVVSDIGEDIIHEGLEGGGGVCKSKRNHVVLKGAKFAVEHCLPFISFLDTNQMVCVREVKASINVGLTETVKRLAMRGRGYKSVRARARSGRENDRWARVSVSRAIKRMTRS